MVETLQKYLETKKLTYEIANLTFAYISKVFRWYEGIHKSKHQVPTVLLRELSIYLSESLLLFIP